jgi:glycogen operon protein
MWFRADANLMSNQDWDVGFAKSVAILLNGDAIPTKNNRGGPIRDLTYYLIFNGHYERLDFRLPPAAYGKRWRHILDTSSGKFGERQKLVAAGSSVGAEARSVRVLQRAG